MPEPTITTGPNDPEEIRVQMDEDRRTVIITFTFDDGRTVEITTDPLRAEYVGGLLVKTREIYDQRLYDEGAVIGLLMDISNDETRGTA